MSTRQGSRVALEIVTLRKTLRVLDRSLRRLAPLLSTPVFMNGAAKANDRPRPRLSAKARASLVLQGRYMGFMRQLKPRQKDVVRKLRQSKGIRPAITQAARLARA